MFGYGPTSSTRAGFSVGTSWLVTLYLVIGGIVAATHPRRRARSTVVALRPRPMTERRRSRTDPAVGCTTVRVLKTRWATGPGRSAASVPSYLSPSR
jgi:hypothetical protein